MAFWIRQRKAAGVGGEAGLSGPGTAVPSDQPVRIINEAAGRRFQKKNSPVRRGRLSDANRYPLNGIFRSVESNSVCIEARVKAVVQLICEGVPTSVVFGFHPFHRDTPLNKIARTYPESGIVPGLRPRLANPALDYR